MTVHRFGRRVGIAALVLLGIGSVRADLYLYGLNAAGKTAINGNVVETLPGDFDADEPAEDREDAWIDLQVVGADRYALRRDGLVTKNGAKLATRLPSDDDDYWVSMAIDGGTRYAIRQDGKLAANEVVIASLPSGDDLFTRMLRHGGSTYSLRSDGAVFRDGGVDPFFRFRDGSDGDDYDTLWIALKVHPTNGYLYALRSDGSMFRGLLAAVSGGGGEGVTRLPFSDDEPELGDLYADLDFDSAGRWLALRRDGRVYRDPDAASAWLDFPGSGDHADATYMDLVMWGDSFFALCSDGRIYSDQMGAETELLVMSGSYYGKLALDTAYPVLAAGSNTQPYVTGITATVVVGTPVHLPVVVTDAESAAATLIVTPVLPLPTGATYDDVKRILHWDAPTVKGSYTFSFTVVDGTDAPKTYKYKVSVKDPDVDPAKNKSPLLPKFKKPIAIAGTEFRLPIIVDDRDGDGLSVIVDYTIYPFSAGARYDSTTREFVWTPGNGDLGKYTIPLTVTDGVSEKTVSIKFEAKASLAMPLAPVR